MQLSFFFLHAFAEPHSVAANPVAANPVAMPHSVAADPVAMPNLVATNPVAQIHFGYDHLQRIVLVALIIS